VDVLFCHRPDYATPLEETIRAMNWLIKQGKAIYWATSEWPADRVAMCVEMCKRMNLRAPIADQCEYSMLVRNNCEKLQRRVFSEYRYGSTVWSPLAMGILAGKYNDGNIPEDSRFG
jgi:aryl-alcohol dehydrogenase-like predicted oxidoreductase